MSKKRDRQEYRNIMIDLIHKKEIMTCSKKERKHIISVCDSIAKDIISNSYKLSKKKSVNEQTKKNKKETKQPSQILSPA